MSVISARTKSSRVSRTPSILKKSTSLKNRISQIVNTPIKVRFTLPHAKKVRSILEEYVSSNYRRDYDHLLCTIRDSELFEADIVSLLREANDCISLLNTKLRLFVEAILSVKWLDFSDEVASEYKSFVTNLVAAHHEHSKLVIDILVNLFLETSSEQEWIEGQISTSDSKRSLKIHAVLNSLLSLLPLCGPLLVPALTTKFPFVRRPTHIQEYYMYNLLWLLKYTQPVRSDILYLIISKLVVLDTSIPREKLLDNGKEEEDDEVFTMEVDARPAPTPDSDIMLGHTLDVLLDQFFTFLSEECYNASSRKLDWETTKGIYKDMIAIFDDVILPTYGTHHVQFIMFFLCSFKQTLAETFLDHLWKKVCNPSAAAVIRQSAVIYIASLVARATYMPLTTLKAILQEMAQWIHSYISNQDAVECVVQDIRAHLVFYTVCQSLFYLVAFRHRDLVTEKKNIVFLESLNLGKIVTSRLNPLRVCQPAVVQNFAAITRKYQLAYCYTVMEHNARNVLPVVYEDERGRITTTNNILDSYFPFDPYLLSRSSSKIHPHYRDYSEYAEVTTNNSDSKENKEADDSDDFLENSAYSVGSPPSKSLRPRMGDDYTICGRLTFYGKYHFNRTYSSPRLQQHEWHLWEYISGDNTNNLME